MTQESLVTTDASGNGVIDNDQSVNDSSLTLLDFAILLAEQWKLLVFGSLAAGLVALGVTYLVAPTFTSRTVFLPPQQQQSLATSALASLGALGGLAGASAGIRSPIDQYVTLLQSTTVADRIIDEFNLMKAYDQDYRVDARKQLTKNLRVTSGRRDGLITVEADDEDPQRAADIANRYVDELRSLTGLLALTEAQQRRAFFEVHLQQTRAKLTEAEKVLQASGFSSGAMKAEPRAAAEGYARLRAELTTAEVRLQTLRRNLADAAPEVQQLSAAVIALRDQLAKLATAADTPADAGYIGKYREFKYQEALFELFSRQFEVARLDESRDGMLIQVVDKAKPAEKKTRPRRALTAIVVTVFSFLAIAAFLAARHGMLTSQTRSRFAEKWDQLAAKRDRRRSAA